MLVRHPEDGRWGVFVSQDFLHAAWMQAHPTKKVETVCRHRAYPNGYPVNTDYNRAVAQFLREQEFDAARPCEAYMLAPRYGYGFFYLPPDPAP